MGSEMCIRDSCRSHRRVEWMRFRTTQVKVSARGLGSEAIGKRTRGRRVVVCKRSSKGFSRLGSIGKRCFRSGGGGGCGSWSATRLEASCRRRGRPVPWNKMQTSLVCFSFRATRQKTTTIKARYTYCSRPKKRRVIFSEGRGEYARNCATVIDSLVLAITSFVFIAVVTLAKVAKSSA